MPNTGKITEVTQEEESPAEAKAPEAQQDQVEVEAEADDPMKDLSPEDEIWPDGPKKKDIDSWKEAFGQIYITSVTPETHIVWRTLSRFEYRRLVKLVEQQAASGQVSQAEANLNNEEAIAETVILYPPYNRANPASHLAGVATLIAQEVMDASGFVALEVRAL